MARILQDPTGSRHDYPITVARLKAKQKFWDYLAALGFSPSQVEIMTSPDFRRGLELVALRPVRYRDVSSQSSAPDDLLKQIRAWIKGLVRG
jgi:hypothetical protein